MSAIRPTTRSPPYPGLRQCGQDPQVRATEAAHSHLQEVATALDAALQKLAAPDKPAVAAVQGAVAGAGLAVMRSCDLVVAAETTRFVTAYAGIVADPRLRPVLPAAPSGVSPRALELFLWGRVVTPSEALEWGMVTEVHDDKTRGRAEELSQSLATCPTSRSPKRIAFVRTGLGGDPSRRRPRGGHRHRARGRCTPGSTKDLSLPQEPSSFMRSSADPGETYSRALERLRQMTGIAALGESGEGVGDLGVAALDGVHVALGGRG